MSRSTGPEILRLWPTLLLRHRLPGAEAANPVLLELIAEQEAARPGMTVDYLGGNLLDGKHPALGWLRDCVNRAVIDYVRATAIDYDLGWSLQGWANVNRFGDYHNLHNHPHAWLSGTYYVAVPEPSEEALAELPGRSDRTPGAISFFDPRPQANMNAVKGDPQVDPEYRALPKAGELYLWPAFLHHLVHPNLAREPRVSVSFNVMPHRQDELVP